MSGCRKRASDVNRATGAARRARRARKPSRWRAGRGVAAELRREDVPSAMRYAARCRASEGRAENAFGRWKKHSSTITRTTSSAVPARPPPAVRIARELGAPVHRSVSFVPGHGEADVWVRDDVLQAKDELVAAAIEISNVRSSSTA
jgi:hypothetical protein